MTTQVVSANIEPTFLATLATLNDVQTLQNKTLRGGREFINYVGSSSPATGTLGIPATTPITYYTANATGNFVINITGVSTLSAMAYAESITVCVLVTNGTTAYYMTGLQIDGSSVTPKYQGAAPNVGTVNGVDSYCITIMKDYSSGYFYRALVSQTSFV